MLRETLKSSVFAVRSRDGPPHQRGQIDLLLDTHLTRTPRYFQSFTGTALRNAAATTILCYRNAIDANASLVAASPHFRGAVGALPPSIGRKVPSSGSSSVTVP